MHAVVLGHLRSAQPSGPGIAGPFEGFAAAVPEVGFASGNTAASVSAKSLEKRGENPLFPVS